MAARVGTLLFVVRGNGRPKGCFWRVHSFSAPSIFALKTPESLRINEEHFNESINEFLEMFRCREQLQSKVVNFANKDIWGAIESARKSGSQFDPDPNVWRFSIWFLVGEVSPYYWSLFCPDQVLLSKNFHSRAGCRQKSLLRNSGVGGGGVKSDPQKTQMLAIEKFWFRTVCNRADPI